MTDLLKLAGAAPGGLWSPVGTVITGHDDWWTGGVRIPELGIPIIILDDSSEIVSTLSSYIAAASPNIIVDMFARIAELEAALARIVLIADEAYETDDKLRAESARAFKRIGDLADLRRAAKTLKGEK